MNTTDTTQPFRNTISKSQLRNYNESKDQSDHDETAYFQKQYEHLEMLDGQRKNVSLYSRNDMNLITTTTFIHAHVSVRLQLICD